ncbi:MAG: NAD+ synthase [Elusimicrobiota bacterium]
MKIALCQINTKAGDVSGNLNLIIEQSRRAEKMGGDIAVFPEQTLAGYPSLDLWEDPDFLKANARALAFLAKQSRDMGVLIGAALPNPVKTGKPALNAAALVHRGRLAALRGKTLLPTYDVFDEARYFESAETNLPVRFKNKKIGISICEDAWASSVWGRRLYKRDPVREQVVNGADILLNLSASPFERGKNRLRLDFFSRLSRKFKKPFFYCNLIGGNDEIIFDGGSAAFDARGRLLAQASLFSQDIVIADTQSDFSDRPARNDRDDIENAIDALCLGIKDYASKCGFERVFIGLSGGIDSAVVGALAAKALGPERVTGIAMPSRYSSPESLTDARVLARNLNIRFLTIPIHEPFQSYLGILGAALGRKPSDLTEQNLQARIRGTLLMALANHEDGLVLSTGNKSELSVGYCTLYGDMAGGLAVLADAPKKVVYEIARRINREKIIIPKNSIMKAPSAELKPNQKDQDDLPPYEFLDAVIAKSIEEQRGFSEIIQKSSDAALTASVLRRIELSEYKRRQAPPGLRISPKAFGIGRRMPIARGHY